MAGTVREAARSFFRNNSNRSTYTIMHIKNWLDNAYEYYATTDEIISAVREENLLSEEDFNLLKASAK